VGRQGLDRRDQRGAARDEPAEQDRQPDQGQTDAKPGADVDDSWQGADRDHGAPQDDRQDPQA
jgi:hypothetical protein